MSHESKLLEKEEGHEETDRSRNTQGLQEFQHSRNPAQIRRIVTDFIPAEAQK